MATRRQTVSVDGRQLRVTSLDKVLYPAVSTTKAEVLEYYHAAAPAMLPLLAGRPVTRKRWPDGTGAGTSSARTWRTRHPSGSGRSRCSTPTT